MKQVLITKHSGIQEIFSDEKLRRSLSRSGAATDLIDKVVLRIRKDVERGKLNSTEKIYRAAFKILTRESRIIASKYHLRKAIMEMGPTGHPFEYFVARIFEAMGYKTAVSVQVSGACVNHEVDVVAEKNGKKEMIECKFHNQFGIKSDVKTALYVHARFEDIRSAKEKNSEMAFNGVWLVTNTKLTDDAIQYGKCAGMNIVGWSYPDENNLQALVERFRMHPVTCITTLNGGQKQFLLDRGIVLCRDIFENRDVLRGLNLSKNGENKVFAEIEAIVSA